MSDFCDCSQCPHHCDEKNELDSSVEVAQEKIAKLEAEIESLGFKVEETKDGIKVSH